MERVSGFSTLARADQEARNYHAWVYRELRPFLGWRVLEIGPGYGDLAAMMLADGRGYSAVDADAQVIARLRSRLRLPPERLAAGDVRNQELQERFRRDGTDTVFLANVLEHLEDDRELLAASIRCAPGGRLAVMVPALPALYGSLDRQAGHFRRYTRASLGSLLRRCGLEPRRLFYFNALGAVAWFVAARVLRLPLQGEGNDWLIPCYDRCVVPAMRLADPLLRRLGGQSLIAAADIPG